MLMTISDYCAQRNVSKQFVYEYIRKGKLTVLELPTFVELNGERVTLGMQKMLDVSETLAPKVKDSKALASLDTPLSKEAFVSELTDNPYLHAFYVKYLSMEGKEAKKAMKSAFYAEIDALPNGTEIRDEIDEVNLKMMQYMRKQGSQIKAVLNEDKVATQKELVSALA
jgi:hypothetical protein